MNSTMNPTPRRDEITPRPAHDGEISMLLMRFIDMNSRINQINDEMFNIIQKLDPQYVRAKREEFTKIPGILGIFNECLSTLSTTAGEMSAFIDKLNDMI